MNGPKLGNFRRKKAAEIVADIDVKLETVETLNGALDVFIALLFLIRGPENDAVQDIRRTAAAMSQRR